MGQQGSVDTEGPGPSAVRGMVARRTGRLRLQRADREEVVSAVLERLAAVAARRPRGNPVPLGAILSQNVDWAIADFCRSAARRGERERLSAPESLPERPAAHRATFAEQLDALEALLRPLSEREREIVFERYVMELSADEVGVRHGMREAAVQMACTRALRKLKQHSPGDVVGFLRAASVAAREGTDPAGGAAVRRSRQPQGPSSTGPCE